MHTSERSNIARRAFTLSVFGAILAIVGVAHGADDIANIDPASDTTATKVLHNGVLCLKVTATFNNGYSGGSAHIIDPSNQADYGNNNFTSDGMGGWVCYIELGPSTYTGVNIKVSAFKLFPQSTVFKTSTNVNIVDP